MEEKLAEQWMVNQRFPVLALLLYMLVGRVKFVLKM